MSSPIKFSSENIWPIQTWYHLITTYIIEFVRKVMLTVPRWRGTTLYPKKYAHGFCFAVLCCGYTLTDFPISIRLTSLALWQSNDCPSANKATLMNMNKYFTWIHYERLHNHNKAKHNITVCIFLGIYCTMLMLGTRPSGGKSVWFPVCVGSIEMCEENSLIQWNLSITIT